jgi:hypothetical protein
MHEDSKPYSRKMTAVRVIDDDDGVQVVFLESAQFYRLSNENPAFDSLLAILRDCVEKGIPVEVNTESVASNIIEDVRRAQ